MKVFVIGATGVLGRNVIPRLLERGHRVHAVVRQPRQAEALRRTAARLPLAAKQRKEYEFCGLHFAMCPCARNLVAGKAVCRECKGGWDVGEGRVAGIKAAQVKGMSAAQALQMLKSMHHTARAIIDLLAIRSPSRP